MAANQNVTQLTQQAGTADTSSLFYAVTGGTTDTGLPFGVFVNSLGLTGTPTCPTATIATNTTQIASTAFVHSYAAPLASPTFTGVPAGPTAAIGVNTTQLATTAYVLASYSAPPVIGGTTPSVGNFTSLSTTSLATLSSVSTSSATLTGGTINSMAIGGTTPSSGAFTTITASSTITPSQTSGIVGTTTNNNANAGSVGEYISATVASGSAVSLTTGTAANVTSISLTAGDWDVWGNVGYTTGSSTVTTYIAAAVSTTSAALVSGASTIQPGIATGQLLQACTAPMQRLLLSGTTTVFLVAQSAFATSTQAAYGFIGARRRR